MPNRFSIVKSTITPILGGSSIAAMRIRAVAENERCRKKMQSLWAHKFKPKNQNECAEFANQVGAAIFMARSGKVRGGAWHAARFLARSHFPIFYSPPPPPLTQNGARSVRACRIQRRCAAAAGVGAAAAAAAHSRVIGAPHAFFVRWRRRSSDCSTR